MQIFFTITFVPITKLNISSNAIKDEGIEIISQVLRCRNDLIHLDVSSNEISPRGFSILFESLMQNNTLISLNISSIDHWYKNRIGIEGARALKELIKQNIFIQFLNLSSISLGDEGLEILTKGIIFKYNSQNDLFAKLRNRTNENKTFFSRNIQNISSLILKSNELTPNSMDSICNILSSNIILWLDLSNNKVFSPSSMKQFSKSISNESMSLKILKLK